MKKALLVIVFTAFARWTNAEDVEEKKSVFNLSGEARVKQFLINDEPDQIKLDYRGNNDHADEEIGLVAHATVCEYFHINAYPYFWASRENQISRVGLNAEAKVNAFFLGDDLNSRFAIGYGHHSWHNADAKFKGVGGRSRDWLFAEIDFLKLSGPGFC
ncbi:MAG: hypothetical protein AAB345_01925 [Patescibacteria group bacterium]